MTNDNVGTKPITLKKPTWLNLNVRKVPPAEVRREFITNAIVAQNPIPGRDRAVKETLSPIRRVGLGTDGAFRCSAETRYRESQKQA